MTPETLRSLIAEGETENVEFKGEERGPLSNDDLVETVVCLANRPGSGPAWLLVGVEDDGRVTGARLNHDPVRQDLSRLAAMLSSRTRPSLSVRVQLVTLDEKPVLVIEVPSSDTPVGTTSGRYLRRALGGDGRPACVPMHFHEMQSRQASRGLLDYSALVIPEASWDDLDPLEFERLRRSIRERRGRSDETLLDLSNLDMAKALGAVEANGQVTAVRVLGLLLFGKEEALRRWLPSHEVAFQVIRGVSVEVNDFFRWPLLRVMEEIEARFRALTREEELLVGMLRVGVPDYSPAAFREGLANALIHRDYTRFGAVHVQWFDDRIEISSPGGFPEGVRLDNLLVTAPRPRNPLLADAFKRAGIVERTARGIDTIFYEQLRNGRPAPSYERSDETTVVLVLPGGRANLNFVRLVVEENLSGRDLDLDSLLILNALWQERFVTTEDVARLIQKPQAQARATLNRLVEAGLVEARGEARWRGWHLSAATYRRLGDQAAYLRLRGFDSLQQEQLVLKYLEQNGRITRREVADLCQIGPYQASRLLNRMVEAGRLVRRGRGRGTWYERVPQRRD